MKISINIDEKYNETQITVCSNKLTLEIERLISMIRISDMQLTGKKDGEVFLIDVGKILYVETVDKRTFVYMKDTVYESDLKLYELEEQLNQTGFLRISKSCLMNMRHVISLKADLNRRIIATTSNQEKLVISRQYSEAVKARLGVK